MLLRSQLVNPHCVAAVKGRAARARMTAVAAASSSTVGVNSMPVVAPDSSATHFTDVFPCPVIMQAAKGSTRTTSFHHGVSYTSYEVNTFMLKFNATGARVLIDPCKFKWRH